MSNRGWTDYKPEKREPAGALVPKPKSLSEEYAENLVHIGGDDKRDTIILPPDFSNTTSCGDYILPTIPRWPDPPAVTATSPKSLDSSHKIPVNLCPASAIIAIALVIAQGHKKPGRTIYNWRQTPISYMAYHGAAQRHLLKSIDGSDFDPELSELAGVPVRHDWAAMSCLAIIEDARQCGTLIDDRPTKGGAEQFLESVTVKK